MSKVKHCVPKLRFPEFRDAGEWKRKPLGSLLTIGNGKDYKHLSNGDIPVYGSGGYMHSVNDCLYEAGGVPSLSKTNINKIEVAVPTPKEQQKIADCLSSIDEVDG